MIKFLFDNFRNMPGIGKPIKVAYIGHLVNEVVKKGKDSPAKEELINMGENDLQAEIKSQANSMFDEHIMPMITAEGIPAALVQPAKKKGIDKIAAVLREEADKARKKKKE